MSVRRVQFPRRLKKNIPLILDPGVVIQASDTDEVFSGTGTGRVLLNPPGMEPHTHDAADIESGQLAAERLPGGGWVTAGPVLAVMSASFTITEANGTWQDTGFSITLPAAGTWLIWGVARAVAHYSAGGSGCSISARLHDGTSPVPDSEALLIAHRNIGELELETTPLTPVAVTVATPTTLKLQAVRKSATTWANSQVSSNADGRTVLLAMRAQ